VTRRALVRLRVLLVDLLTVYQHLRLGVKHLQQVTWNMRERPWGNKHL